MEPHQILETPPVFRIADETLADIFLLNTSSAGYWDANGKTFWVTGHDPCRTTRYSSQVCQRWRDVALGYSTLWSRIIHYEKDPLPWIDELLRRSHPATFELGQVHRLGPCVPVGPRLLPDIIPHVACHAQRLKTVNMVLELEAWQEMCEGILQIQAPNLEYFYLTHPFPRLTLVFTGTLFSDHAPCLRRLHLLRCLVNLSSTTLSNLTELSVEEITSGTPTVDAWLSILGNMPFLRWLTIVDAISGPFPTRLLPTPNLPNLLCLSIKGNLPECVVLVEHIACSPLGVLRLNCVDVIPGHPLKQLLSMIEERLSLWLMPAKADRNFVFKCLKGNVILIGNSHQMDRQWDISESEGAHDVLESPVLSIGLSFADFEEMESSALPFLLGFSHVFTTVCRLTFWLDSTTEHMFNRFLGTLLLFNNVEEIDLLEGSFINFLPPLQTPSDTGASAPPTPPLASLRTILLTETIINGPAFDILVSYLQYRQRMMAPIETLEIGWGCVSSAQREVLQRLTVDLKADVYDGEPDE